MNEKPFCLCSRVKRRGAGGDFPALHEDYVPNFQEGFPGSWVRGIPGVLTPRTCRLCRNEEEERLDTDRPISSLGHTTRVTSLFDYPWTPLRGPKSGILESGFGGSRGFWVPVLSGLGDGERVLDRSRDGLLTRTTSAKLEPFPR